MYSQKNNLTIKIVNDSEGFVMFIDDEINPVRVPLAFEDAEKLVNELQQQIERVKNEQNI